MDFSNISLKDFLFLIDNNYKLSKEQFNDLQRNKIIKYYNIFCWKRFATKSRIDSILPGW